MTGRKSSFALALFFVGTPACDWISRGGPPAQQKFEREEIYASHQAPGEYRCTKCGAVLFRSEKKLSIPGARWPIFEEGESAALWPEGAQVSCARCRLHVGHRCRDGKLLGDRDSTAGASLCALSASLHFENR